jgi:hypothetical protein
MTLEDGVVAAGVDVVDLNFPLGVVDRNGVLEEEVAADTLTLC